MVTNMAPLEKACSILSTKLDKEVHTAQSLVSKFKDKECIETLVIDEASMLSYSLFMDILGLNVKKLYLV